MASSLFDPDSLLVLADGHRAARDWLAAAEAYRQFVTLRPDAWSIMIQEGHCLKEAGRVAEALARYRDAEAQAPEDSDLQVQIGHALKLLGRWREAARAYARAVTLAPDNRDARREAEAVAEWLTGPEIEAADRAVLAGDAGGAWAGPTLPEPAADAAVQVVFDITDVLLYFNNNRTPTGIQRVQIGIVTRALSAPAGAWAWRSPASTCGSAAGGRWTAPAFCACAGSPPPAPIRRTRTGRGCGTPCAAASMPCRRCASRATHCW
jgi:tetratricopeptide (TPR) repeat protein